MNTERLYYHDSNMQRFSAIVVSCEKAENGFRITLDRTAFYPEGGGQPGDTGSISGVQVFDTKAENGEIVHFCTAPLTPGQTVEGVIDFDRRFDFMQQHSGEHIVSGIIHKKFGYENVGFHMGADMVTIDLSGMLTMDDLRQIEREANIAVWQDIPIEITYLSDENKDSVFYRSKKVK